MDNKKPTTVLIAVKVLVGLAPALILQEIWRSQPKIAYALGLVLWSIVAWYCIPPRNGIKGFVVLIIGAIVLGIARIFLP